MAGTITSVVKGELGQIEPTGGGQPVAFGLADLRPASFAARGPKVGDFVRYELAWDGLASRVWRADV